MLRALPQTMPHAPPRGNLKSARLDRHLWRVRVVVPQTVQFSFVRRAVGHDEPVAQRERFAGSDFHVTRLLRREIQKRLCRMNALWLRRAHVVGMAEHSNASESTVEHSAQVCPAAYCFC